MLPFGLILLSYDPLPSLDHAYQPIVQDERVRFARGIDEEKPANVLGFVVHATSAATTMSARTVSFALTTINKATMLLIVSLWLLVLIVKSMVTIRLIVVKLWGYPNGW